MFEAAERMDMLSERAYQLWVGLNSERGSWDSAVRVAEKCCERTESVGSWLLLSRVLLGKSVYLDRPLRMCSPFLALLRAAHT